MKNLSSPLVLGATEVALIDLHLKNENSFRSESNQAIWTWTFRNL